MIPLAFSTNAFKKNTLEEAIAAIASIGYRGVELMADRPHLYPADYDSARRQAVIDQLKRQKLAVKNFNAFTLFAQGDTYHPTWIEEDRKLREIRIAHTIACIELASQFGSKTISVQPGGPLIGTTLDRDAANELFAASLRDVLSTAQRHNITIAIEPEPGLLIETSLEYRVFKERFFKDELLVRMNCDVGHLYCVGEDPAAVIRSMPQEVVHIHLEDIGANRVHQHLAPGKGAIDFPAIFDALDTIAYDGWVTVELYPYEASAAKVAEAAWTHLRRFVAA